jgi:pimeloyl-ACP methyl ester carboxylesterase/DNA-binding CsgD family transcriptional regulator
MVTTSSVSVPAPEQRIRFCRTGDGVRIAYAAHGSGPPLLVVSCWLSHLQYDWSSPVWRHFLDDLGSFTTLYRYDERGFGLSDWTVEDFSLEARLSDLEVLVAALGLERFAMMGMSGGAPVAMAYAAKHGHRVDRLILYGGSPVGRHSPEPTERELAFRAMIRAGWAQEDPLFRRVFTNMFIPDATEQQMGWYDELQRMSTSTENAVASRLARQEVDLTDALPTITAPTLVLHARQDAGVPFDDAVLSASLIPNARLVPLESRNHILLADEPAWAVFVDEVRRFVGGASGGSAERAGALSPRERQILELAAEGHDNAAIAERLVLSVRTVERHLSNAYLKLGVGGPAARAAAVAFLLRHPAP